MCGDLNSMSALAVSSLKFGLAGRARSAGCWLRPMATLQMRKKDLNVISALFLLPSELPENSFVFVNNFDVLFYGI